MVEYVADPIWRLRYTVWKMVCLVLVGRARWSKRVGFCIWKGRLNAEANQSVVRSRASRTVSVIVYDHSGCDKLSNYIQALKFHAQDKLSAYVSGLS